ncbi:MAG: phosphoribosyltransferase family protein [Mycetocola sp.]
MDSTPGRLARAVREALALVLPVSCVGCGQPDSAVCPECATRMSGPALRQEIDPGLPVWAGTAYTGAARRAILALKNEQRTDAASALARVLASAVDAALPELTVLTGPSAPFALAALPSTRSAYRRRGYRPVDVVVARTPFRLEHPLVWKRQPADQISLTLEERKRNLDGSLLARKSASGRSFLLVDDVVTTGATLLESRRALTAGGARVVGAVAIAATERRLRRVGDQFGFVE